jgi:hypothetical protein
MEHLVLELSEAISDWADGIIMGEVGDLEWAESCAADAQIAWLELMFQRS